MADESNTRGVKAIRALERAEAEELMKPAARLVRGGREERIGKPRECRELARKDAVPSDGGGPITRR